MSSVGNIFKKTGQKIVNGVVQAGANVVDTVSTATELVMMGGASAINFVAGTNLRAPQLHSLGDVGNAAESGTLDSAQFYGETTKSILSFGVYNQGKAIIDMAYGQISVEEGMSDILSIGAFQAAPFAQKGVGKGITAVKNWRAAKTTSTETASGTASGSNGASGGTTQLQVSEVKVEASGVPEANSALLPAVVNKPQPTRGNPGGPTIDSRTGHEVGRFIVDPNGNTMIEPLGGSTSFPPSGVITTYPNGSNYQRLDLGWTPLPNGSWFPPHGHAHAEGKGPFTKGQGPSLDVSGNKVKRRSKEAHFPIYHEER